LAAGRTSGPAALVAKSQSFAFFVLFVVKALSTSAL